MLFLHVKNQERIRKKIILFKYKKDYWFTIELGKLKSTEMLSIFLLKSWSADGIVPVIPVPNVLNLCAASCSFQAFLPT